MGKKLVLKTAKVLSETKKTKERQSVAIAYEHIPRSPKEQAHGSIYAIVELTDTSGHAEEIADGIIDSFYGEYYNDTEKEPLASFESALAKVNEDLAERSSEGQINWLGKLNAVLAVLSEDTLHLSQVGKSEAFLYRAGQEMHITEDLSGDSINPLRTFINVASGELTEKDRLVFATPGVFLKLSKKELQDLAEKGTPKTVVSDISRVLSGENGNVPNAVLVMEMISPEAFAADPEPELESEAWVKEDKKVLEPIAEETLKGTAKAIDLIGKAGAGAAAFISTKAVPLAREKTAALAEKIKGFRKEKDAERIIIEEEEKISRNEPEKITPKDEDLSLEEDPKEMGISSEAQDEKTNVNEFRIREEEPKPKLISLEKIDTKVFLKAKDGIFGAARKLTPKSGKKSKIILAAILVAILFLGTFIFIGAQNARVRKAGENNFAQAKTKYEEATQALAFGEEEKARESLETSKKLLSDVKESGQKIDGVDELLIEIEKAFDQVDVIVRDTATLFFDFAKEDLGNIFFDGKVFYGISHENGSIYALDPKSKSVADVVTNPSIEGKIKLSALIASRRTVIVYTQEKQIYEIDLVSKRATRQNISGSISDAVSLGSFGTNIYLLSPKDSQIFRHQKISGGYTQGARYFSTGEGIGSGVTDMAIDSSIYVLASDGSVQKFTAGKRDSYKTSEFPKNFGAPQNIFASPSVSGQYLFSKDRVIKIEENGRFFAQYINSDLKNIKSLYVQDDTRTIFVLSEGKIYTIAY